MQLSNRNTEGRAEDVGARAGWHGVGDAVASQVVGQISLLRDVGPKRYCLL